MGDGHAGVGPGVVAGDAGVQLAIILHPARALDTRRVPTSFHIHKQYSSLFFLLAV